MATFSGVFETKCHNVVIWWTKTTLDIQAARLSHHFSQKVTPCNEIPTIRSTQQSPLCSLATFYNCTHCFLILPLLPFYKFVLCILLKGSQSWRLQLTSSICGKTSSHLPLCCTHSRNYIRTGQNLSFPFQNGVKLPWLDFL